MKNEDPPGPPLDIHFKNVNRLRESKMKDAGSQAVENP